LPAEVSDKEEQMDVSIIAAIGFTGAATVGILYLYFAMSRKR
jgi:hypothetical protein